jgi:uncharacterized RDD family membrane protein YckC
MTCSYCGTRNGEGEHRCRLCGRKPGDTLTGEFTLVRTDGALATQLQPNIRARAAQPAQPPQPKRPPNFSRAVQTSFFQEKSAPKVVPIRHPAPAPAKPRTARPATAGKSAQRRVSRVPEGQGKLDFLPSQPVKPRTLATTVEAMINCEAPVATLLHRAVAAALDASMVLIAYGLFLLTYGLLGGQFEWNKTNLIVFGAALGLIALSYGLVWTIAGAETAGMYWTHLRLTTFDGFPPEPKQRVLRFMGSCLSLCTLVGLLWSLVDEECLTWQDHISCTFPTPREGESQVFRRV